MFVNKVISKETESQKVFSSSCYLHKNTRSYCWSNLILFDGHRLIIIIFLLFELKLKILFGIQSPLSLVMARNFHGLQFCIHVYNRNRMYVRCVEHNELKLFINENSVFVCFYASTTSYLQGYLGSPYLVSTLLSDFINGRSLRQFLS